jgi:adenylate kinase
MFNLILFGPPGSGKGTQSIKIAEKYGLEHISTGEIFRNEIRNKTEIGLKVKSVIDSGELVTDELLLEVLKNELKKHKDIKGFIFDGYPRTLVQAGHLDELMKEMDMKISYVISLDVHDDELISRLLLRAKETNRTDDTEEVIKQRLVVYNRQTKPLIDYYSKQGKLLTIHGVGGIDDIFKSITTEIDNHENK